MAHPTRGLAPVPTDRGASAAGITAPVDCAAIIRAALDARNAGRPEEGIGPVREALKSEPRNAKLWQTLGLLHRARDDSKAAIDALEKAARLAPRDARIAHAHARVTMEAGLACLPLYDRARALAPLDGDVLISRAAGQLAQGEGLQAIEDLDRALAESPAWVQGQAVLANLRWMLKAEGDPAAGFERAIARQPADLAVWLGFIEWLIKAELFERAEDIVRRARRQLGDLPVLLVNDAVCASELGDSARADPVFAQLADFDDTVIAVQHIRHLLRNGRAEEAARRAEPLLDGPGAAQVWPYVATIWRLVGDDRWSWLEDDPRLVGVYDIAGPDVLEPLARRLRALHNTAAYPVGQSVRGGTQTDGPLFARIEPEIRALRKLLAEAVEDHLARLGPVDPKHPILAKRPNGPVRFAGSWSVRLDGSGRHTNHIHPQGWFSSAFYVSLPAADELGPAPAGWLALGQPPAELGIDLAPFRTIEPRPGRLALFPSIMWHGTIPFTAGERLTVAFDVAAPGAG